MGAQDKTRSLQHQKPGGGWDMWKKIAAQDPAFGHPEKVLLRPRADQLDERHRGLPGRQIIPYIKNICKRDPFTGK